MDYYPGGDLFNILNSKRLISEDQTKFYIAEIILGVNYLHELGILYRDLKVDLIKIQPENVMLDWKGHVKLVDFGLSKKKEDIKTRTYSFVGSEGYASPEIMRRVPYNYLTDVYSIGAVMYDLLHGCPPFTRYNPQTKNYQISDDNTLFLRKSLSEDCKNLLCKLLDRRPESRLSDDFILSLLDHPWFDSIRPKIISGVFLDPPFQPDLTEESLDIRKNDSDLKTILEDLQSKLG